MLAETRDNETGGHITRTKYYVRLLAEKLAQSEKYCQVLTPKQIEMMVMSAPLHDIGKIGIRDSILNKPGKFTPEEFIEMQTHTVLGYEALVNASRKLGEKSFLTHALDLTLGHHEKWNGTGYPRQKSGEEIPLVARIMAVGDVYDALISERVYKPAIPHEKAVEIIRSESGAHFDPDVVQVFLECEKDFKRFADQNRN